MLRQEDNTVIDYKEWKKKVRRENFKRTVKDAMNNVGNFCKENAYILVPIAVGATVKVGKDMYRDHRDNKEMRESQCRFYDRRTSNYVWSKRPLKAAEKLILEDRYANGERKSEILRSMGLLKY